ncbi:MAG: flagellar basal body-associated FliL family protein [Succinivibrionaceae bacterium]|nr:flagellar basal body-associated FliL family protein [Succinivibrionaceae bacterium]
MLKKLLPLALIWAVAGTAWASGHKAEDEAPPPSNISYFELAPEIITNYATPGNRIGYVRVKVQIMVDSPADLEVVQYNAAVLRDIVITSIYSKDLSVISSPVGRDSIVNECKSRMDAFFQDREGRRLIREVLFTNFIFQ